MVPGLSWLLRDAISIGMLLVVVLALIISGSYAVQDAQKVPEKDPKLSSSLFQAIYPMEGRIPIHGLGNENWSRTVTIYLEEDKINESNLNRLNNFIEKKMSSTYSSKSEISADVLEKNIPLIKNLSFVSYIDPPTDSYNAGLTEIFSSKTPDSIYNTMGIAPLRKNGYTGKNVNVAILDSEFYHDDYVDLDLPDDTIFPSRSNNNNKERHGIACAKLVTYASPGIRLHLIDSGRTLMDFLNAVKMLDEMDEKLDVVLCPKDFFAGMFNGKDEICRAIEGLTSNGTIWVNSAGNMARKHWSGSFRDHGGDGFNDFGGGDETINVSVRAGDTLMIWLSWNDQWLNSTQDYDLYILASDGTLYYSNSPQSGIYGHKPMESLSLRAPHDGVYEIKIKNYNSTADASFHLFSNHDLDEYANPNSSLGIIACCDDVIAIGAVNATTRDLEPYSSRGPSPDGRVKPDLVAPDNVEIRTYEGEISSGTSVSSSYVAGCIALAIEALGYSGAALTDYLIEESTDLGAAGPDSLYGNGLINISRLG